MSPGVNIDGVCVVAPTPFHFDRRIDYDSIDRMTDSFFAFDVYGIAVLGQMGEVPKRDHQEALDVARKVIQWSTVPVIIGVSAPRFAAMKWLAGNAMEFGAAAVMVARLRR